MDTTFDDSPEDGPRRFLLTWFPEYDREGEPIEGHCETVAVVAVDEVAKGNVAMHPVKDSSGAYLPGTGGNAWRGADNWAVVLPVIRRWLAAQRAL